MLVFDVKNKINPVTRYTYKKGNSVEFTLKARTIRRMRDLLKKHDLEIVEKKGILFPFTPLAPFVIIVARKVKKV